MAKTPERKPSVLRTKKETKPPLGRRILESVKQILFALAAVIVLNSFVLASFQVPTPSMENTVMAGDLLFVNKFLYGGTTPPTIPILGILTGTEIEIPYVRTPGFRDPERGDVIVFIFPGNREEVKSREFQYYLKRCVAVSGDTIQVINKALYINGKRFPDSPGVHYLSEPKQENVELTTFPRGKQWTPENYGPLVVPKTGNVIRLTDENLREWETFIKREGHEVRVEDGKILIDGKPSTSYSVERDYVFGMGDNRDNSLDSRFWGFIPKDNVVGTPMIVYWSWDPNVPLINLFKKLGSIRFGRLGTIIR